MTYRYCPNCMRLVTWWLAYTDGSLRCPDCGTPTAANMAEVSES